VRRGVNVGVMKPAETGCAMRAGRLIPRDALRLIKAAKVRDSLSLVNPYRFKKPLAPAVAAAYEGVTIKADMIYGAFQKLSSRHDFMIVEGAGGIMVPLQGKLMYLDLVNKLKLPVLIVARPGLGTINHTLLTVDVLRKNRTPIAGIVINYALDQKSGLAEKTSPAVIEKMSGIRILGTIPHASGGFGDVIGGFIQSIRPRAQ